LLLTSLKNFLTNAEVSRCAAVRGGGVAHAVLDESTRSEAPQAEDPEDVFLRHWALAVLQRAMQRMRSEAEAAGKLALFDALSGFLIDAPESDDYARLAEQFDMRRNTLAVAVHRLRQRLRDAVRDELAETVCNEADLESELDLMRQAWGGVKRRTSKPEQADVMAL
jgi:RNA polymerase sigma-70 factor (ECF subfamily)